MASLSVVLDLQGQAQQAAAAYLPGPASAAWSAGGVSVAVRGDETGLLVEPDLVVAVAGRLAAAGAPTRTGGSAVADLARAWRRHGPEALRGLRDDLVVAVVRPAARQVHVFRDVVGAIPVHLSRDGRRLVVSTSLPSLVRAAARLTADERWVSAFLRGDWPPLGVSPYAEVVALPPGHLATGSSTGWSSASHDDFAFVHDVPSDLESAAERFRQLFDDAVLRRLQNLVGPVAVTLSGGLDSSSVLTTARMVAPERDLVALSLGLSDMAGDERSLQAAAAQTAGAELVLVDPRELPGPFGDSPEAVLSRFGAPPLAGNAFLHEGLLAVAESRRVQRVLDGEDGDGVVGVHPVYLADVLATEPTALLREVAGLHAIRGVPRRRLARRAVVDSLRSLRAGTWGRAHVVASRGLVRGGYLSALAGQTQAQWEGLTGGVAHPFLDRAVLEYALCVPYSQKVHAGVGKVLLRRALVDRLPNGVLQRRDKSSLGDPFRAALLGPQWEVLQDGLALARRIAPDIRQVPVIERRGTGPNALYAAYRAAFVAIWRNWLTTRTGATVGTALGSG